MDTFRFRLDIGDFSQDGHHMVEPFIVECDKDIAAARDALFAIKPVTGAMYSVFVITTMLLNLKHCPSCPLWDTSSLYRCIQMSMELIYWIPKRQQSFRMFLLICWCFCSMLQTRIYMPQSFAKKSRRYCFVGKTPRNAIATA